MTAQKSLIVIAALATASCASIAYRAPDLRGGATQQVEITSEPSGALVRVDGVVAGETPTRITVRRKDAAEVLSFEKDGTSARRCR